MSTEITLVAEKEILHACAADCGPRIERIQCFKVGQGSQFSIVEYWHDGGKLSNVTSHMTNLLPIWAVIESRKAANVAVTA